MTDYYIGGSALRVSLVERDPGVMISTDLNTTNDLTKYRIRVLTTRANPQVLRWYYSGHVQMYLPIARALSTGIWPTGSDSTVIERGGQNERMSTDVPQNESWASETFYTEIDYFG